MSNARETLFASATPGLEAVLSDEVRALGGSPRQVPGGVEWDTPAGGYRQANLWLRTATRVWLRLRSLGRAALEPYWDGRGEVELEVAAGKRGRQVAGDVRRTLKLPEPRSEGEPSLRLLVRAEDSRLQLSVDTSGELLYRRGYRQEVSRAPMRETLAAGVLALAGHRPEEPLWDPMCGSGTLVIEAALRARGLPPGSSRDFAFERFPSHEGDAWRAAKAALSPPRASAALLGSDLNAGSLGTARRNARRAGVLGDVTLFRADATKLAPPSPLARGLLLSNLPYGERVGERSELPALYQGLCEAWRQALPGWRAGFLVTDARALETAAGRPADRRFALNNGGLRCALLVWDG